MTEGTKMIDREVRAAIRQPILLSFDLANEEERLICGLMPHALRLLGADTQDMRRCNFADGECVRVLARTVGTDRYSVIDFTFKPIGVGMWEFANYNEAFAVYHQTADAVTGIKRHLWAS